MKDKHYALKDELEAFRIARNKIALKVQKIKDRVTPLVKKEVAPHLGEYDDTETVQIVRGKIIVQTFSHLEEWIARFKAKKNTVPVETPVPIKEA
jgi:ABC-type Zn uptake system ZnuABC Zn-binding protein ZnuA